MLSILRKSTPPVMDLLSLAKQATLENLSTNIMIADVNLDIIFMNKAVTAFLLEAEKDIQRDLPNFAVAGLVGKNIDTFHKNPSHQRGMLAKLSQPYLTSIKVGGRVFTLRAFPIYDLHETRLGSVVEWQDSQGMDYAAQIAAINKSQAVIEFNLDGTIIRANDNFLNAMGYRLDEIVGKHHSIFIDGAYRDSSDYKEFWTTLNRGEFQAGQYKRLGKGGKEVWIEATYNPVTDTNGKPFKVVKYATDVTAKMDLIKILDQNLGQINKEMNTVSEEVTTVSGAAVETSGNIQTVAAGAEELNASVEEITRSMTNSKQQADSAYDRAMAADALTGKLTQATNAMTGIVKLIQDIASQVNLLSLNATIEAARAGDAGKGFAVVANEVKNLAKQAADATEQITKEIQGVQSVSGEVVGALKSIQESINSVRDYVSGTAAAVEEQSAVARDMSSNMQTASQAVEEVSRGVAGIVGSIRTVNEVVASTNEAGKKLAS